MHSFIAVHENADSNLLRNKIDLHMISMRKQSLRFYPIKLNMWFISLL